jgi:hypothetical protein
VVKPPPSRPQRLFHRMDAVEDFHRNSVEGQLGRDSLQLANRGRY